MASSSTGLIVKAYSLPHCNDCGWVGATVNELPWATVMEMEIVESPADLSITQPQQVEISAHRCPDMHWAIDGEPACEAQAKPGGGLSIRQTDELDQVTCAECRTLIKETLE